MNKYDRWARKLKSAAKTWYQQTPDTSEAEYWHGIFALSDLVTMMQQDQPFHCVESPFSLEMQANFFLPLFSAFQEYDPHKALRCFLDLIDRNIFEEGMYRNALETIQNGVKRCQDGGYAERRKRASYDRFFENA